MKSNYVVQTWVNCFGWTILFAAVVQKSPPKIFPTASRVLGNHLQSLIFVGSFLRGLTVSNRIFWFQCTLLLRILNWRGSQLQKLSKLDKPSWVCVAQSWKNTFCECPSHLTPGPCVLEQLWQLRKFTIVRKSLGLFLELKNELRRFCNKTIFTPAKTAPKSAGLGAWCSQMLVLAKGCFIHWTLTWLSAPLWNIKMFWKNAQKIFSRSLLRVLLFYWNWFKQLAELNPVKWCSTFL